MAGGATLPTERQVQRGILKMLGTCFPRAFVFHIPNGAHLAGGPTARFKQMGALKGDGLKIGMCDLGVLWPGRGGAFIECKRPKTGRVSDDQKAVHELLESLGWRVCVASSEAQAFEFVKGLGCPWNGVEWK